MKLSTLHILHANDSGSIERDINSDIPRRHLNGSVSDLTTSCRSEFVPAIRECELLPTLPELSIMGGRHIELKVGDHKMTEHLLEFLEGILWNENSCGEKFQNGKKNSEKPRENFWRGPNTFSEIRGREFQ